MSEKSDKTQAFVPLWASAGALALFLAIAGWYGYSSWRDGRSNSESTDSVAHRRAPNFRLKDAAGQSHDLSSSRGKWIIVHFWASWCPPCIDEIPNFLEFAKKMTDAPLQIVTISLDSDWKDAQKMLPQSQLASNMVSLLDPSLKIPETYGSYQYPETYLLAPDSEGHRIRTKWVGAQEWNSETMQRELREVFAKETPK